MNGYGTTTGIKIYYANIGTDPVASGTQLAGIDDIVSLPKRITDVIETTRVDQEDGGQIDWFKQFAPGHTDPGQGEFKFAMNETQLETFYTLQRQIKAYGISFSSGGKLVCNAFIIEVGQEAPKGDEVVVPVKIQFTGKPVFTKAA
jgi:hypothetical protein